MPYIKQEDRTMEVERCPDTVGELNYAITYLLTTYLARQGLSYPTINDIMGALEGAKLEFYRRVAGPYEDEKKELNGDVYP